MNRHLSPLIFIILFFVSYSGYAQMNPTYAATIGGGWSGPIKRGAFLAQDGVVASQKMTSDHWERITVDSFTISIIRKSAMLFAYRNFGNKFGPDLRLLLNTIEIGDKVLVFDIYGTNRLKEKVFLQPLQYIIE